MKNILTIVALLIPFLVSSQIIITELPENKEYFKSFIEVEGPTEGYIYEYDKDTDKVVRKKLKSFKLNQQDQWQYDFFKSSVKKSQKVYCLKSKYRIDV